MEFWTADYCSYSSDQYTAVIFWIDCSILTKWWGNSFPRLQRNTIQGAQAWELLHGTVIFIRTKQAFVCKHLHGFDSWIVIYIITRLLSWIHGVLRDWNCCCCQGKWTASSFHLLLVPLQAVQCETSWNKEKLCCWCWTYRLLRILVNLHH